MKKILVCKAYWHSWSGKLVGVGVGGGAGGGLEGVREHSQAGGLIWAWLDIEHGDRAPSRLFVGLGGWR